MRARDRLDERLGRYFDNRREFANLRYAWSLIGGVTPAQRLLAEPHMTNEQIIRRAYALAEKVDIAGWVGCFTPDGTFTDNSINVTYRGAAELGKTVELYAKAFPDMHRELFRFFTVGDIVVVELALQGTHEGPLPTPMGVVPPTHKRMDAPCADVFRLVDGKIQSFNCYPSGTVIFSQLGILENIKGAIDRR